MSKTKNEVELEIRVKALEDTIVELTRIVQIKYIRFLPDLNTSKMEHYEKMKKKYPDLNIEYPG